MFKKCAVLLFLIASSVACTATDTQANKKVWTAETVFRHATTTFAASFAADVLCGVVYKKWGICHVSLWGSARNAQHWFGEAKMYGVLACVSGAAWLCAKKMRESKELKQKV